MQITKGRPRALDALGQGVRCRFAWIVALLCGAIGCVAAHEAQIGVINDHLIGHRVEDRLRLITALAQLTLQPLLLGDVAVDGDGADDASVSCSQGRAGDTPIQRRSVRGVDHRLCGRSSAERLSTQKPGLRPLVFSQDIAAHVAQGEERCSLAQCRRRSMREKACDQGAKCLIGARSAPPGRRS